MFAKFFFAKIGFWVKKHDFCKNPIGFCQNSLQSLLQKVVSAKNFFPDFRKLFCCLLIFAKILNLLRKLVFLQKLAF
jgi:hypothetical protein